MIRYMLKEYFYKTILSARFLIVLFFIFLGLYVLFHPAAMRFADAGYAIGAVELLPCILFDNTSMFFFVIFIFLTLAYPQWEGATERIPRLGKKRWMRQQYFYIALTAALYYLIWTIAMIVANCPNITWKNEWSSFIRLSQDEDTLDFFYNNIANVSGFFSDDLLEVSSPFAVWGFTFLLNWLCAAFLGIVVVVFNTSFRRGCGTLIAIAIVAERAVFDELILWANGLQKFLMRLQEYISPLDRANLHLMASRRAWPLFSGVLLSVAYYFILIAAVVVFGRFRLKKTDLSQKQ